MERFIVTIYDDGRHAATIEFDGLNEVFIFLGEQVDFSYCNTKITSKASNWRINAKDRDREIVITITKVKGE